MNAAPNAEPIDYVRPNYDGLPEALKPLTDRRIWAVIGWGVTADNKMDKSPRRPDLTPASSKDPATWSSFADCMVAFKAKRCRALGIMLLNSDVGCLDLDHVVDGTTIASWAAGLMRTAGSYVEQSLSGSGYHILGHARGRVDRPGLVMPGIEAEAGSRLDMWSNANRFLVITGQPAKGFNRPFAYLDGPMTKTLEVAEAEKAKRAAAKAETKAETKAEPGPGPGASSGTKRVDERVRKLIEDGVPETEDRSAAFYGAVARLRETGWSVAEIEAMMRAHPAGIAAKYLAPKDRLKAEILRAFLKAKSPTGEQPADESAGPEPEAEADDPYRVHWHGEPDDSPIKEWAVEEMLPKVGTALISAQWGMYKTFLGFDLTASILTRTPFAGQQTNRQGGVLWIAVEGQSEVRLRLQAVVNEKIRPAIEAGEAAELKLDNLPFAWIKACPKLSADNALAELQRVVGGVHRQMMERFGLPLAMVLIDTLSPAADLKDADDTAENQRVMSVLKKTANQFDTLVIAVDHFGKDVKSGTRNSSVKEADVDAVLASLGERDLSGTVTSARVAVRKVRGAPTGREIPFGMRVVEVVDQTLGTVHTTLVVDWSKGHAEAAAAAASASAGKSGKSRKPDKPSPADKDLRESMLRIIKEGHAVDQRPEPGLKVQAVPLDLVREEFKKRFSGKPTADARRIAFNRAVTNAKGKDLVATREFGEPEADWIWFVDMVGTDDPD